MGALDEFVYLMEEAFGGTGIEETNETQSLLGNLRTVGKDSWRTPPPGGSRTIASIVLHIASCKVMYADYAFGPGQKRWDDASLVPWADDDVPQDAAIEWLVATHEDLMAHVRALGDDDLGRLRMTNWGEQRETRWLLATLMQHDVYHAGEINHLRALTTSDDTWKWA
ncbi:MAG TPA: DinB family protein [Actinomycetota bacterium]|nr:DinB family protein [Actinomycetota bacterium]